MGGRALPTATSEFSTCSTNYSPVVDSTCPVSKPVYTYTLCLSLQPRNPHDDRLVLNKHGSIYPQDTEVSGNSRTLTCTLFPPML